jgi:Tfp pilus assembly protein PilP
MTLRTRALTGLLTLVLLPVVSPSGGLAQQQQPASKPPAQPSAQTGQPPAQGQDQGDGTLLTPNPDTGDIDEILQGEEDVLSGNSFSYDPGNRRDPFKSLLAGPERTELRGPRPEGIPGLLIDEIDLKGIWRTGKGFVAQVVATNQKKTYLLKEGDQLYDGDVVSINHAEVVFKQIVQDPTALKPFREVVKSLNPSS